VVHFLVEIDGSVNSDLQVKLRDITMESTIHLPDVAVVSFHDKGMGLVDSGLFEVGKSLKILSRENNKDKRIFDGEIVQVEPQFSYPNIYMTVRAFDRLHRLNRGKYTRDFQNMSDADIAKKIAGEMKLGSSKIESTSPIHPYVFQDNETNLEFLQKRAEGIGYTVFVRDKELHFEKPQKSDVDDEIELNWGQDGLMEFQPQLTTLDQHTEIEVRGWDDKKKKAIVARATKGESQPDISETDHTGKAQKAGGKAVQLLSTTIRNQSVADQLATAEANRNSGGFVQAEGTCGGNPGIVAGAKINIPNIGDKFKGTYVVTHATHRYNTSKSYTTDFSISAQHTNTLMAMLENGSGKSDSRAGFMIGIVTNCDDPEDRGRVKVKLPALSDDKESDWARVVSAGAGKGRGFEWIPDINDEVMVGFEQGDIHLPYILGGLWNGVDVPFKKKGDYLEGGHVVRRFIQTNNGKSEDSHLIIIDDSSSSPGITIQDSKGNVIHIDTKKNKIEIHATGDIEVKADKNLELKGQNVKITGDTEVSIKAPMINIG
jgi:phage protein D